MEYGQQEGSSGLDFQLEPEEEEYYRDDQCAALTAAGHLDCARTFRAKMPEPVRFSVSSFIGTPTRNPPAISGTSLTDRLRLQGPSRCSC